MQTLIDILHEGHHSLVVAYDSKVMTFNGRGVSDLYRLLSQSPEILDGACVADKVVGKGAAALMILGKVKAVHTDVISTQALRLFERSAVKVSFGTEVSAIINRAGDGICPVESLCFGVKTAAGCLPLIAEFVNSIKR